MESSPPKKPWRKILYEEQDYPDNYVDKTQFLNGLKKNSYTQTYGLQEVILVSGVVTQELSSVCIFVGAYWFVQEQWLSPLSLFSLTLLLASVALAVSLALWGGQGRWELLLADYGKPAALFISFLSAVSPILKTLTESISTDTIWAMTVGMLLVHLLFFNYGSDGATMVSGSISLNAAIFASVCLASRLPSSFHGFVVVSLAVLMFALFPDFRVRCKAYHSSLLPLMTLAMVALTSAILASISLTGLVFYGLAVFSLTFVCPLIFVRLQHLKNNIYGPWDEATIQL
jgi:phosphatidylinositol glycan class C protein